MDDAVSVGDRVKSQQLAAQGSRLGKLSGPKRIVRRIGSPAEQPHGNLGPGVKQAVRKDGPPFDANGGQVARGARTRRNGRSVCDKYTDVPSAT